MKNPLRSFPRSAIVAVIAGALCCSSVAFAQENTTYAPDPGDDSGAEQSKKQQTQQEETTMSPRKVGSMTAVGSKPRKGDKKDNAQPSTSPNQKGMKTDAKVSADDKKFVTDAVNDGLAEIHMGQMAAQNGKHADVKKLGNRLVADHSKANQQLLKIANDKGIRPQQRPNVHKMSKRDMENFDQAWLAMVVKEHQKDVAEFRKVSQSGNDPELRAFAKKTLPVLEKHLQMAQAAQQKLGTAGMGSGEKQEMKKQGSQMKQAKKDEAKSADASAEKKSGSDQ